MRGEEERRGGTVELFTFLVAAREGDILNVF